VLVPLNLQKFN